MIIVGNAVAAVAKIDDLLWAGHIEVNITDMDDNEIEVAALRYIAAEKAGPTSYRKLKAFSRISAAAVPE